MAVENLEAADFEHILAIVRHGDAWYVYIDTPADWWRKSDELIPGLLATGTAFERLLVHEQGQKIKYARHPLSNQRNAGTFPVQVPRWRIRVTADCGEEQAEWQLEMLDDSAWSTNGYDLKECLGKLGRRLQFSAAMPIEDIQLPQKEKPKQAISIPTVSGPNTLAASTKVTTVPLAGTIEDVLTARLEAIGPEIAEQEQRRREVTLEIEKKLDDLRREQRAVSAARSAYREKTYKHRKAVSDQANDIPQHE